MLDPGRILLSQHLGLKNVARIPRLESLQTAVTWYQRHVSLSRDINAVVNDFLASQLLPQAGGGVSEWSDDSHPHPGAKR